MLGSNPLPLSVSRLLVLSWRGVLRQRLHEGILGSDDGAHADVDGVQGGDGAGEGEHVGVQGLHRSGGGAGPRLTGERERPQLPAGLQAFRGGEGGGEGGERRPGDW